MSVGINAGKMNLSLTGLGNMNERESPQQMIRQFLKTCLLLLFLTIILFLLFFSASIFSQQEVFRETSGDGVLFEQTVVNDMNITDNGTSTIQDGWIAEPVSPVLPVEETNWVP